MPRGAEYENGLPLSDNAIETGETKAHGIGSNTEEIQHTKHTAPLLEGMSEMKDEIHSGGGSHDFPAGVSGKGGHDPHPGSGERKGLDAHKGGAPGAEAFKKVE